MDFALLEALYPIRFCTEEKKKKKKKDSKTQKSCRIAKPQLIWTCCWPLLPLILLPYLSLCPFPSPLNRREQHHCHLSVPSGVCVSPVLLCQISTPKHPQPSLPPTPASPWVRKPPLPCLVPGLCSRTHHCSLLENYILYSAYF